jgi:hypothetical protein
MPLIINQMPYVPMQVPQLIYGPSASQMNAMNIDKMMNAPRDDGNQTAMMLALLQFISNQQNNKSESASRNRELDILDRQVTQSQALQQGSQDIQRMLAENSTKLTGYQIEEAQKNAKWRDDMERRAQADAALASVDQQVKASEASVKEDIGLQAQQTRSEAKAGYSAGAAGLSTIIDPSMKKVLGKMEKGGKLADDDAKMLSQGVLKTVVDAEGRIKAANTPAEKDAILAGLGGLIQDIRQFQPENYEAGVDSWLLENGPLGSLFGDGKPRYQMRHDLVRDSLDVSEARLRTYDKLYGSGRGVIPMAMSAEDYIAQKEPGFISQERKARQDLGEEAARKQQEYNRLRAAGPLTEEQIFQVLLNGGNVPAPGPRLPLTSQPSSGAPASPMFGGGPLPISPFAGLSLPTTQPTPVGPGAAGAGMQPSGLTAEDFLGLQQKGWR